VTRVTQPAAYGYLLGIYLGDGYRIVVAAWSESSTRTPAWPLLFPQHGAGRKHLWSIVLESWQHNIVEQHPVEFVRGCIDSNGCRHRRLVAGRNHPAYSFTNHSPDILDLFVRACGLIGLRPRRANRVTVSIARRADVAALDRLFEVDPETHRVPRAPVSP
jgi:hypothetical protein